MSAGVTMAVSGPDIISYTVVHRGSCVLIVGEVPANAFGVLAQLAPEDSVMDSDVARMYGATFAFGPADELQALRVAAADTESAKVLNSHPGLSQDAAIWLASGERGVSSDTIFSHLTGVDALRGWSKDTPHDVGDFRRCRLLLEQVPELVPLFPRMSGVSATWAALLEAWDGICAAMDAEFPSWRTPEVGGSAPKSYQLIKQALGR